MKLTAPSIRRSSLGLVMVAVAIALAMGWWISRPATVAQRFQDLVAQDRIEEADAMLSRPSALVADEQGGLSITTREGATLQLGRGELPLQKMDSFYYQPRPSNFDYLAGRFHFPLVTKGPQVNHELSEPVVLTAISTASGIVIVSAKRS
jgi:hypothetical protein